MKKIIKIISIIIFLICILLSITNVSFALDTNSYKPTPMTGGETIKNIGNTIIGILQLVGSIFSVIVLIVIGIKYLIGSVEEKAQYKETMKPYIIGAVLVFSITNILKIISDIMANIS